MATLVLRTVKGTPLTNAEVDGNFSNINSEVGTAFNTANTINSNVGILSNLTTSAKSNLVAAINEIAAESTSSVGITGGSIANVTLSNVTVTGLGISGITTANVTELSNLYFTNARVLANVELAGFYNTVSNTAPIGASESGTTLSITHLNSGVTAATYGNATNIPIITIDASGHITSASNVALTASGGGGSGLFNTAISAAGNVAVDTTAANVYAAPSTAGKRYIIHSIHITNIDGTNPAEVTAQIIGSTYSSISFGNTIPVPAGTSVELLKKPKILQPSDYISLNANVDSRVHATATIEEVTGTNHFGAGIDITSAGVYTNLHTATAASVIESVLLSNDDPTLDVKARVVVTDSINNIVGYYAYDLIVPADSTVELLEQPKYLPNGFKVRVYANQPNRLEAIIAGKVI
jgi:hypothetical protein